MIPATMAYPTPVPTTTPAIVFNVGISEESLRIQRWLSLLEPHARHQDVRNRRLDGVGDWVLENHEFESWHKSLESSGNPTLLCYGDQGAGKTYIRYQGILRGAIDNANKELY